jgi:glucose-1-phosphate cytidylyltransferase
MKAVILAGGYGTRISEESATKPKPMIEIGGKPMLWHIMKIYSQAGINDFVICCGYKGYVIKEYFANYFLHTADFTFDIKNNKLEVHHTQAEPWRITLVDTGEATMTGGRIKRIKDYVAGEPFCLTYGDGVCDMDMNQLLAFHHSQKSIATLTAVQPPGRFGAFTLREDDSKIHNFSEKTKGDGAWINGGFFVLEPEVFDYFSGDESVLEQEPLMQLAHQGKLAAYRHDGFWQNMDTLRDKNYLESLWAGTQPPWKIW